MKADQLLKTALTICFLFSFIAVKLNALHPNKARQPNIIFRTADLRGF